MVNTKRQVIGRWGEELAAVYLSQKGYDILYRNYRTRYGEIDLIARQDEAIVFIEVKTRSNYQFGFPEDSVSLTKINHIKDSASTFFQEHPQLDENWRVDVIAILRPTLHRNVEILHFQNVVTA